jgi:leader peptidase (prepilin peptidase)/N-methyltransferase
MLFIWLALLFALGAAWGSFLNVCIYRLPWEKSVLWPGSRCGKCFQAIRWYDNLPLISYLLLRGRCRVCGARFSVRYPLIELLTGVGFAGLFYLEVGENVLRLEVLRQQQFAIAWGIIPLEGWLIWLYHATLFSFLVVASFIDIDHQEIPLSVTVTGTVVGLVGGALLWPWLPAAYAPKLAPLHGPAPPLQADDFKSGVYLWPVWTELPAWLPPRCPLTGLATGLAGMLAGMLVLRAIGFLFKAGRGREGMGLGDADLMMMVGAFLGWQPVIVAFFVAVFPGLVFGIIQVALFGDRPFPYGPSLAAGSVLTWLGWHALVERFPLQLLFFDPLMLGVLGGAGAVFLFLAALVIRLLRGAPK